ncbi:nuclear transport factor 2 family protein [Streptomyces sp. NPDC050485]|uniref:nuclear transport factor 2 family protein n=1 Tax=Streptomyces sp. NPDC050485 TaxID=3365617 RepID=UPI00379FA56B
MSAKDPKVEAIEQFFTAYAAGDMDAMSAVLAADIEWTVSGRHPLSGVKRGVAEVRSLVDQLGKTAFKADPIFFGSNDDYVVDVHRSRTAEGIGNMDTVSALVWHFNTDGQVDRVINLSSDQHQIDNFIWDNFALAPLPDRLG